MKIKLLFLQLVLIVNIAFSQKPFTLPWGKYNGLSSTITFKFCEEMLQDKDNFVFQIFLIYEQDTFTFPQIGKYEFLNPIRYYHLNIDTTINDDLKLLFINSRYVYSIEIVRAYLFQKEANFCIKMIPKRNQFNFIQYDGAYTVLTIGKREKIKKGKIGCVPCN